MMLIWRRCLLLVALVPVFMTAHANADSLFGDQDRLPTVDEAIVLVTDADWDNQQVLLDFELYDNLYLYQHQFKFTLTDTNGNVLDDFSDFTLPEGKAKTDEIFGDVEVYFHRLSLALPLQSCSRSSSRW